MASITRRFLHDYKGYMVKSSSTHTSYRRSSDILNIRMDTNTGDFIHIITIICAADQ